MFSYILQPLQGTFHVTIILKTKLCDFRRKGWYCNIESQLIVHSFCHVFSYSNMAYHTTYINIMQAYMKY